ncbi:MAG TPA: hypothetical protein VKB80_09660 [Kofleriaceae bacterium]|nr:hypothetical protein [Kofleriaceae bacterium]
MLLSPGLILVPALLAGCPSRDVSAVDPNQSKEQQKEIPVNLNRNIDILWVVDNSGSMEQEQRSLARNFPEFARVLEGIEGGLPDIHMAVVSSDVGTPPYDSTLECQGKGDDGLMQVGACPLDDGALYISDVASEDGTGRVKNYAGELADQFSCMAQLGTEGCGFEQHLESMKLGLSNPDNGGFLRDNAFLAVIFIQDEDDCSASDGEIFNPDQDLNDRDSPLGELSSYRCFEFGTSCQPDAERTTGPRDDCTPDEDSAYIAPVTDYIDFLRGLKDDPSQVIVAAITAPPEPANVEIDPDKDELWVQPACVVCDGGGADCDAATRSGADAIVAAAPAVRMNSFLEGFPSRSTFQNICTYDPAINDVDLSGGLTQIGLLLKRVVGNPCIEGKLAEPVDCRVSDVRDLDLDTQEEFPIQSCDDSGPPCFSLVDDQTCMTESNLALQIDRGDPPQDPPPNTTVVVRCLVN